MGLDVFQKMVLSEPSCYSGVREDKYIIPILQAGKVKRGAAVRRPLRADLLTSGPLCILQASLVGAWAGDGGDR